MATLQSEFSLVDIEIVREVIATYNCGPSRVALKAPDQTFAVHTHTTTSKYGRESATIIYRTLKLQYAIEVWFRAVTISEINPGRLIYYWWLKWKDGSNGFRSIEVSDSLKYYDVSQEQLINGFMKLLRDVANSGEIKVNEYCHSKPYIPYEDYLDVPKPTYEVVADAPTANAVKVKVGKIADYDYSHDRLSFTWDEIKDFFCILTLNQLRLVNHKGLHTQSFWDKVLFQGASSYNISMMQYAIENGANLQSFDSGGESVLVSAIQNARYPDQGCDTAKIIETLDFLLSQGADIDAFGYDGIPPLMSAYYASSVEIVKYLLERGANVNFNCYLMDGGYWPRVKLVKSSIIEDIENSYYDSSPEDIEIAKLIENAGGYGQSPNHLVNRR